VTLLANCQCEVCKAPAIASMNNAGMCSEHIEQVIESVMTPIEVLVKLMRDSRLPE
jgi:hypothetical protein